VEAGVSAFEAKHRSKFDQMRRAVEDGQVHAIVAPKLDRLGRNTQELIGLLKLCIERGVALRSIAEGAFEETAASQFQYQMLSAMAEFESNRKSERVRDVNAHMRSQGLHVGRPPWGYRREGRRTIPSADARLIRLAFELYDDGATVGQVVAALRAEPREERTRVTLDFISKLLRNPVYAGFIVANTKSDSPQRLPGEHEPLVPADRFDRVQQRLKRNAETGFRGSKFQPLGRLGRCGYCLGPLRSKTLRDRGITRHYITCATSCARIRGVAGARTLKSLAAQQVEIFFVAYLYGAAAWIDQALATGEWRALAGDPAKADRLLGDIARLELGRSELRKTIVHGHFTEEEAAPQLSQSKKELEELKNAHAHESRSENRILAGLHQLAEDLCFGASSFDGAAVRFWTTTPREERLRTLERFVQGVWLGNDRLVIQFKHGLDQPLALPAGFERHTVENDRRLAAAGFDRNVRPGSRARSGGRSPSPPCGVRRARD